MTDEISREHSFSWETEKVLRQSGWVPGRRTGIEGWVQELDREGFSMHSAARSFLSEFGGLSVDVKGPGLTCAREPFSLFPTVAKGEFDRISDWGEELDKHLYPVGEVGPGRFFIVLDGDSHLMLVMDLVAFLGDEVRGLESLVRGIAPEWTVD